MKFAKLVLLALALTLGLNAPAQQTFRVAVDRNGVEQTVLPDFSKLVYVDTTSPLTATIFDEANPPETNDASLKGVPSFAYITTDGKVWTCSNATTCKTAPNPTPMTEWVLAGTSTDAGADKTNRIARSGHVAVGKTTHSGGHALEVVTNMQIKASDASGAGKGIGLEFNSNAGTPRFSFVQSDKYMTEYGVDTSGDAYFKSLQPGSDFRFSTNGGSGSAERFTILANGNTGVNSPTPLSRFDVIGSMGVNINLRGANPYTVAEDDFTVVANTANAVINLAAPAAIARRIVHIKNGSTGNISIVGHIDGTAATTHIIPVGSSRTFHTNGTTWYLKGAYAGHKNTTVTATAGQTSFTLTHDPVNGNHGGTVQMFRNGVLINPSAVTVVGRTVTYNPANNGGATLGALVAGDVIVFFYTS